MLVPRIVSWTKIPVSERPSVKMYPISLWVFRPGDKQFNMTSTLEYHKIFNSQCRYCHTHIQHSFLPKFDEKLRKKYAVRKGWWKYTCSRSFEENYTYTGIIALFTISYLSFYVCLILFLWITFIWRLNSCSITCVTLV